MKLETTHDPELSLLGRTERLFDDDIVKSESSFNELLSGANCLVVGAAGTIGQAVTLELFKRNPKSLHVVDISENNMVELVRTIRSSFGYSDTDFRTFAIDCGSKEFETLMHYHGPYDYVFNLSALKHVRSEKDPFTLMRMLDVNIFNSMKIIDQTDKSLKKYFCVSTDKAANPTNMMGASKRIMELFTLNKSSSKNISMARFANVAFSDGSLLHGFSQRILKKQPISSPNDIRRYFITKQEAGELCLISGMLGDNRQILFPKLESSKHLIKFSDIAVNYLQSVGYSPYLCDTEDEARAKCQELIPKGRWPCYFFKSDTSGEKPFEEFYTDSEELNLAKFFAIGVIELETYDGLKDLDSFRKNIYNLKSKRHWSKNDILEQLQLLLPNFKHNETGKNLDQRM